MAERLTTEPGRSTLIAVTDRASPARAASWVARAGAALAVAMAGAAVALPLIGGHDYLSDLLSTPEVAIGASFSVVGAVLAVRRQARVVGWLLLGIGVSSATFAIAASSVAFALGGDLDAALPAGTDGLAVAAWLVTWTWLPSYVLILTVLPHVLPDGRLLGRWWAVPVAVAALIAVLEGLSAAVQPGPLGIFPGVNNPLGSDRLHGALNTAVGPLDVGAATNWTVAVLAALAVASIVVRLLRTDSAGRRQLGWVGFGLGAAVVVVVVGQPLGAPPLLLSLAVLLVPGGIAVAALRYRLYDLDLVVNRTLVAGVLVAGAAVLYAAVVGWLGALLDVSRTVDSFLAAFAIALAFHPARVAVQRQVDRLFFGRRGDPHALLGELNHALREAATPRQALQDAVGVARTGLRLSGFAVDVDMPPGDTVRAEAGTPAGSVVVLPLELHGQRVGTLTAGARPRDVRLTDADVRVLGALSSPLASAAYALRLSWDLEKSHGRLIEAREEERRRLRRDLHDGLGPQLAGVVMGLDSVRTAIGRGDHDRADVLSRTVGDRARDAVDDVRRLVSGLRPPVLDDLGLVGALRGIGSALGGPDVLITTEGDLSALPAAVEVAAYRIASEAVTNAVRHASPSSVEILLRATDADLTIRVHDDGSGIRPDAVRGVGLGSMTERASELGGWCRIGPGDLCGTAVTAELPMGSR